MNDLGRGFIQVQAMTPGLPGTPGSKRAMPNPVVFESLGRGMPEHAPVRSGG